MGSLSASGARIRGDDYQHIFAWYQALRGLQSESDITSIGIEDPDAGNVDDVTVYRRRGLNEFYQVKSSVDARQAVNITWLTSPSPANGPSMLQRFHKAWINLTLNGRRAKLGLVTNRLADPNDPVIVFRDGRDGTLAARLAQVSPGTDAGKARFKLATHLGLQEDELLEFLRYLRFTMGKLDADWEEQAALLMYSLGLRNDAVAIQAGIATVRGWVTGGKRRLTVEEIRKEVDSLNLQVGESSALLLIQAIDRDPMSESATVALDWVDLYMGDEPRTRRRLHDDALWNSRLRIEVREAAREVRTKGYRSVLVHGHMRLPTWFTVGTEFAETADFEVISFQRAEPWSSTGNIANFPVTVTVDRALGSGSDLAIGLSLSTEISEDVLHYLSQRVTTVGRYICITPKDAPSNQSIRNGSEARGWAFQARNLVRNVVRQYRPWKLHVFLATPHGAALLLGHIWDRMPLTQLYEDQGASKGYVPSFLIPN
jgi:hypothetical protein